MIILVQSVSLVRWLNAKSWVSMHFIYQAGVELLDVLTI